MADTMIQEPAPPLGKIKGKIGVLIESHFDETEFHRFNAFFPEKGYQVEYLSNLWGNDKLVFDGNDLKAQVEVRIDVGQVSPTDYKGIILMGGYAMDRLRYESNPRPGQPNQAPAVAFLRKAVAAMDEGSLHIGTICHSLWLFCAAPELLRGRRVTCAHNIICDVANAGGEVVFDGNQTRDIEIDGRLITGKHPQVVDEFMQVFVQEIEK